MMLISEDPDRDHVQLALFSQQRLVHGGALALWHSGPVDVTRRGHGRFLDESTTFEPMPLVGTGEEDGPERDDDRDEERGDNRSSGRSLGTASTGAQSLPVQLEGRHTRSRALVHKRRSSGSCRCRMPCWRRKTVPRSRASDTARRISDLQTPQNEGADGQRGCIAPAAGSAIVPADDIDELLAARSVAKVRLVVDGTRLDGRVSLGCNCDERGRTEPMEAFAHVQTLPRQMAPFELRGPA